MARRSRFLFASALAALCQAAAFGQSDPLASKHLPLVFGVADKIFAFSAISGEGQSFSHLKLFPDPPEIRNGVSGKSLRWLKLFPDPPEIRNGVWPWDGGAEDGVPWRGSLLLRSDVFTSDSVHVARVASLFYDGKFSASDSLVFPVRLGDTISRGAALTALALRKDTLALGFGRLGLAYARLDSSETDNKLFRDSSLGFAALLPGRDSTLLFPPCAWSRVCRVDTLRAAARPDSVIALAVDSSAPDSLWLLVATDRGLRRGLLGGRSFPRVPLPGIADSNPVAVQRLLSQPDKRLLWAFTGSRFFFSDDHGRTFRVPPAVSGLFPPDSIVGYSSPPRAVISGETTFVNFNLDRPGLVVFRRDTLQGNAGSGLGNILLDVEDSLDIRQGEGSLTSPAVAVSGGAALLALGSTSKGLFYRHLDLPGRAFVNLSRLRTLKGSLGEVITYPTLFIDQPVRIGYRLKKDGKVTITVFNYALEKVRTVVRNAPRPGGVARSENLAEDRWDGRDAGGRLVSVGTYYILVESDQGERGWGKAICARGRR